MAKQTVNIGTSANARNGDPLRVAFDKINDNFDEVYQRVGLQSVPASSQGSAGDVAGMIAVDNNFLYVCIENFDTSSVIWRRIPWDDRSW